NTAALQNMAAGNISGDLNCTLCTQIFTEPVLVPCGHNFCRACLQREWTSVDGESSGGDVRCPICRQECPGGDYSPNWVLANLVEIVKRTATQEKRQRGEGQEQLCEEHGKKKCLFCLQDKTMCCLVCRDSTQHAQHPFLPLQEAATAMKDQLGSVITPLETKLQHLQQTVRKQEREIREHEMSGRQLETHISSQFEDLHNHLRVQEQKLKGQLRQERTATMMGMERNLTNLRQESQKMQETITSSQAKKDMTDVKDFLMTEEDDALNKVECSTLNRGMFSGPIQYTAWKAMRSILNPGTSNVTLDPDTGHPCLRISEDCTTISYQTEIVKVLDTPKRYFPNVCVLGFGGFTLGKHYWEVDVGGKVEWELGVAREGCIRKGDFTLTPEDGYWTIQRTTNGVYSALSSPPKVLVLGVQPKRIGVYVDYTGGQVSFYNACSMSHLYTFMWLFNERLFPFFSPCGNEREEIRVFHPKV
ncbi:hypothetical protein FKM82_030988, partial [Ascaphus truei]